MDFSEQEVQRAAYEWSMNDLDLTRLWMYQLKTKTHFTSSLLPFEMNCIYSVLIVVSQPQSTSVAKASEAQNARGMPITDPSWLYLAPYFFK